MKNIAAYAQFLADELMEVNLVVSVVRTMNNFAGVLRWRAARFQPVSASATSGSSRESTEEVDRLLIHEFGHQYTWRPPLRGVP